MAGFDSNLAKIDPNDLYQGGRVAINTHMPMAVDITVTGHAALGANFQALDGGIRGAASIGARNAARSILRIALLQTPFDIGDLYASGKIVKGESESSTGMVSQGRQIGGYRPGVGITSGEDAGDIGGGENVEERMDDSPQEAFRKAITSYHVIFDDTKAWFIHEYEQHYRQAGEPTYTSENPHAGRAMPAKATVPDSQGRRRGAYFLKRAFDEIAPNYPDWVAKEIDALIGVFKPIVNTPKPAFDTRPRLVKKVK